MQKASGRIRFRRSGTRSKRTGARSTGISSAKYQLRTDLCHESRSDGEVPCDGHPTQAAGRARLYESHHRLLVLRQLQCVEPGARDRSLQPHVWHSSRPVHRGPAITERPNANFNVFQEHWYGLYIQDQVTSSNRLHLLLGGRYDWAEVGARARPGTFDAASAAVDGVTRERTARFNPRSASSTI
jgi:outer membrane receptor protein involved in Fe transport